MRIQSVDAVVAPLNGALGDLHVQLDRRLRRLGSLATFGTMLVAKFCT